nr:helix-turn-helix domain-containing protein [Angustibacter aerolatus]
MAGRGTGPDFVEALARGLDVLTCFDAAHRRLSLSEVATSAGLARPTARRLLMTLQEPGVRAAGGRRVRADRPRARPGCGVRQRPRSLGRRPAAPRAGWSRRPASRRRCRRLDGSDIVYVARVSVPKAHHAAGRRRHPVPRRAHLAGQGAARRAARRRACAPCSPSPAGRGCPSGSAPRRPACATSRPWCAPAAGRSPTRSWRSASGRWPCRCATATARCARR